MINAPIDPTSVAALADRGLRLALVDTDDREAFARWVRAVHRGFHGPEATEGIVAAGVTGFAYRRSTGVWDDTAHDPAFPVATVNSWVAPLTVPGPRQVDMWSISAVSVAATHRRRGIARALLGAELRTAAAAGAPLAGLTVSESTIYGRFGFAPATFAYDLTINPRRAAWTGPSAPGRVHFIPVTEFRDQLPVLRERLRESGVGHVPGGTCGGTS